MWNTGSVANGKCVISEKKTAVREDLISTDHIHAYAAGEKIFFFRLWQVNVYILYTHWVETV